VARCLQRKQSTLTATLAVTRDLQPPDASAAPQGGAPGGVHTVHSAVPSPSFPTTGTDCADIWPSLLANGPPGLLQVACDQCGVFGRHVVAARAIPAAGEMVLLEEPLAVLKPGAAVAGCPEQSDEWLLTHALLAQGKRAQWTRAYVTDRRAESIEQSAALPWLASHFQCPEHDVLAVFRAVANNAFSLDTAVLRIKYGAAFFAEAALLNHSCAPNCHSRRMGGNMAVFTCRPVAAGEELSHSYIPHDLLLAPEPVRAAHLHFRCECARCCREREVASFSPLSRLFLSSALSRARARRRAYSHSLQHKGLAASVPHSGFNVPVAMSLSPPPPPLSRSPSIVPCRSRQPPRSMTH